MDKTKPSVQRNDNQEDFDVTEVERQMTSERVSFYRWSNSPGDIYSAHHHGYHKIIYVISGSITFGLPDLKDKIKLGLGDRLDLPAGVVHDAVVGPQGVVCLEGHQV